MSNKDIFYIIFCPLFFGGPGVALLWYVFYCLKSGSVSGGSKFGGYGTDSRKNYPTSYWGMILVYSAMGIGLLYLAVITTYAILKRNRILY